MRTAFIQELIRQARVNPKLFLVVGDLGFTVVEPFAQEFPDRFLNAGVAEQNMTGVAAGLASEGFQVFTYSIGNFPTLRCAEQIRNDVCYHNLPVTITAVGGGLAYGNMGYSHHAVQDLALMRTLPNMTVLSPADPGETSECVQFLSNHTGPAYLRLGKAGEKSLHDVRGIARGPLTIRAADSPIAFVSTGSVLSIALSAAETLQREHGFTVAVYSCPLLKPANADFFQSFWQHRHLITLEEHIAAGGFGDLLRQLKPDEVRLESFAISEENSWLVGSQEFLRGQSGLSAGELVRACLSKSGFPISGPAGHINECNHGVEN